MLALRKDIFGIDEENKKRVRSACIARSSEKYSSFAVRNLVAKKVDKLNEKGEPIYKRRYV